MLRVPGFNRAFFLAALTIAPEAQRNVQDDICEGAETCPALTRCSENPAIEVVPARRRRSSTGTDLPKINLTIETRTIPIADARWAAAVADAECGAKGPESQRFSGFLFAGRTDARGPLTTMELSERRAPRSSAMWPAEDQPGEDVKTVDSANAPA